MAAPAADRAGLPLSAPTSLGPLRLEVGAVPIPGYQLLEPLGRGGFGEVWKSCGPNGKLVALKFIRFAEGTPQVELSTFQLLKSLSHPNLLQVFETWTKDGFLVFAMELAERTLIDRLREAQSRGLPGIPFPELIKYVEDAAKGIDFLNEPHHHRAGASDPAQQDFSLRLGSIQHRDIKPQNLLLVHGKVKVADFGLAKYSEHTSTNHTGAMTPAYAAPEFFEGRTSTTSDQYSLALTYCYLRSGRLPFAGTPAQIMAGHLTQQPDLGMVPEDERFALAKALAKKPEDRWPDCKTFVSHLSSCGAGTVGAHVPSSVAAADTETGAAAKTARTSRRRESAVVVLGVCLLLFAAWHRLLREGPSTPKNVPEIAAKNESKPVKNSPATSGSFRVRELVPVSLGAGETKQLEIKVERQGLDAAINVRLDKLPPNILQKAGTIGAGQDAGVIELVAKEGCESTEGLIVLVAESGTRRLEQSLKLAVKAAPAATFRFSKVAPIALTAGETFFLEVGLAREGLNDAVILNVENLPASVTTTPALVDAGRAAGTVQLAVALDCPDLSKEVLLVGKAGKKRVEERFTIAVKSASIQLLPIASMKVNQGEGGLLDVKVVRKNYAGPVQITIEGLPEKVVAGPVTIKAFQDQATVELIAAKDAAPRTEPVRLVAHWGTRKTDAPFLLSVENTASVRPVATEIRHYIPASPTANLHKKFWKVGFEGRLAHSDAKQSAKNEKVHRFVMDADRDYTVDLVSRQFDFYLRIEDSNGALVAQDDDGGGSLNAKVVFKPTRRDDYRLVVTSFAAGATGDYELFIATANSARGGSYYGTLGTLDYADRVRQKAHSRGYWFWMVQGHRYTIDLKSSEFDTYLRLEDSSGRELAKDDDGGGGLDARIVFDPPRDEMYRIVVTSYRQTATGRFQLEIR